MTSFKIEELVQIIFDDINQKIPSDLCVLRGSNGSYSEIYLLKSHKTIKWIIKHRMKPDEGLEREWKTLQILKDYPIIPEGLAFLRKENIIVLPYYPELTNRTIIPTTNLRDELLQALKEVPPTIARQLSTGKKLSPESAFNYYKENLWPNLKEFCFKINLDNLVNCIDSIMIRIEQNLSILSSNIPLVLIHGDLTLRNVRMKPKTERPLILDWESVDFGFQGYDFYYWIIEQLKLTETFTKEMSKDERLLATLVGLDPIFWCLDYLRSPDRWLPTPRKYSFNDTRKYIAASIEQLIQCSSKI